MIEMSGAYDRDPYVAADSKCITEDDKKDLVHWMTYRERRPPSPSPEQILEKVRRSRNVEPVKDRFLELEDEVQERRQFLDEMSKVGLSRKIKDELDGEIADKLREMKLIQKNRELQIEFLEKL